MRSVPQIFNAGDERGTKHTETLSKLRHLFEVDRKFATSKTAFVHDCNHECMSALESELEKKELDLQTTPGLASESDALWSEAKCLRLSIKTLSADRDKLFAPVQNGAGVKMRMKEVLKKAEALMKRNEAHKGEVRQGNDRVTVSAAREQAFKDELASTMAKLSSH